MASILHLNPLLFHCPWWDHDGLLWFQEVNGIGTRRCLELTQTRQAGTAIGLPMKPDLQNPQALSTTPWPFLGRPSWQSQTASCLCHLGRFASGDLRFLLKETCVSVSLRLGPKSMGLREHLQETHRYGSEKHGFLWMFP